MVFANRNGRAQHALAEIELSVEIMQTGRNRHGFRGRKGTLDLKAVDDRFASALLAAYRLSVDQIHNR